MVSFLNPFIFGAGAAALETRGALVHKSSDETYGTGGTIMDFEVEDYDLTGWHDNVANNSRLVVPAGVALVRFGGNSDAQGASARNNMLQFKNGANFPGQGWNQANPNTGTGAINCWSAPVAVSLGDYFEYRMITSSGTRTPGTEAWTWASIEALASNLKYALVAKSGNQAMASGATVTMAWGSETADTDGFHDLGDDSKLVVPSGITLVRLSTNLLENSNSNPLAKILKNGSDARGLPARGQASGSPDPINLISAPIEVATGDAFTVTVVSRGGAASIDQNDATWFAIEEVPAGYKRALVYKTSNQSILASTPTVLTWDAEEYDTANIFNPAASTKLVAPAGVTQARLSYSLAGSSAINGHAAYATKNGSAFHGTPRMNTNVVAPGAYTCGFGAWVDCSPGDEFELVAISENQARDINADNYTWFCGEFR